VNGREVTIIRCRACQHENPPGTKFCVECGARLSARCPGCGAANAPANKFCGECGVSLASPAGGPPPVSPESYTPRHLAEKILTSRAALEGERKQVTVLFADLKGSMELLVDRDPEEARKILDPVLELMMEAVHRYEGTVNQVMGDGIMALFGAPIAHEDHAVRGCYAALRMQDRVRRYADEVQRAGGAPVQIRVGLNSGEVVVRSIGSDLRMDYTAVGQTTHLAARMEQLARPGSTLLTGETLRLAEGYVQITSLGAVPVKGLERSVEAHELTGAGPARSRLQVAAARGLTRFIGRDVEMDQLRQALEQARAGHGQVVAVVGEPGVGKSRLLFEFTRSHRLNGWLVLESGSVSYGKATSYLPVIDLLKAYFKINDRDDYREMREKVIGKLFGLDRALESALPALLALLDVPVEDTEWRELAPLQRRQRTLDAIKRLLLRESAAQPLCLVVEDLHWIDSETQAVLDSLLESLPSAPIILLVNYRPEYRQGWNARTYYRQLRIDPLPPESAEELLSALLGPDPSVAALKRALIESTEGNPFFLEESIRTLVETGALSGERGGHRLAKPLREAQVPATVQAVLAARIDRLPPDEKALLQVAAVIGKDVPFPLLHAVAGRTDDRLRHELAHLQTAEFLYETRLFPDLEHTFKHALTHEVAYGGLLHERRRDLHARIVDAIRAVYGERLAEQVERLAHHGVRAERWQEALEYLEQAAAKAFARSAHPEVVAYLEQALSALDKLPDSAAAAQRAIDLRLALRNSLVPLGEFSRLRGVLEGAERLAIVLGDQARLGHASGFLAHLGWSTATLERGAEAGNRALVIAAEVGDARLELAASFYVGQIAHSQGDYQRAVRILTATVDRLQGDLLYDRLGMGAPPSALARTWLAFSLAEMGAFDAALRSAQEALTIAEAVDHPYGIYHGLLALGITHAYRGDIDRAIALLERGIATSTQANMPAMTMAAAPYLSIAYAQAGRLAEAISCLEHMVERAAEKEWKSFLALGMACLGEAYLLAGRTEAARTATRALELARQGQQRGYEAWVLRVLGEVATHGEPHVVDDAEDAYRRGLELASELGMRPLVAHCHLGFGTLYRRTGKRQEARAHLTTAATMYRDMAMGFWLAKTEIEQEL
jgi:class 3 adenylate cyclase/tetratricopeptide (TPR) repeat protein